MVAKAALSPFAFWILTATPAAANALVRNGRSALSQRFDDAASGRMTPTKPAAACAGVVATKPVTASAAAASAETALRRLNMYVLPFERCSVIGPNLHWPWDRLMSVVNLVWAAEIH